MLNYRGSQIELLFIELKLTNYILYPNYLKLKIDECRYYYRKNGNYEIYIAISHHFTFILFLIYQLIPLFCSPERNTQHGWGRQLEASECMLEDTYLKNKYT